MAFRQEGFSALWDYAAEIEAGTMTIQTASDLCKVRIAELAADLKRQGYNVRRFTLRGQTREYWGLGRPCGLCCAAYMLNANKAETADIEATKAQAIGG